MTMSFSDAAKLSAISRKELGAKINEYAEKYKPKVLGTKIENGQRITVIDKGYAEGAITRQFVKGTSRRTVNVPQMEGA